MTDTVDLSAVQAAPDPTSDLLEPGTYPVTIIAAKRGESPKKKTPCIKVTAEIATGPSKGRVVFDDWWLTPGAVGMVKDRFKACGLDYKALPPSFVTSNLVGRHAIVYVKHEDWINDSNETVTRAKPASWKPDPDRPNDTSVASDPLAPAAQVTATPDDDLPW